MVKDYKGHRKKELQKGSVGCSVLPFKRVATLISGVQIERLPTHRTIGFGCPNCKQTCITKQALANHVMWKHKELLASSLASASTATITFPSSSASASTAPADFNDLLFLPSMVANVVFYAACEPKFAALEWKSSLSKGDKKRAELTTVRSGVLELK